MRKKLLACFVILILLISVPVQAATKARSSNIKSHGVFHSLDEDGRDVLLDSADLYYLATQLDGLEAAIDALSFSNNANVSYVYHHHIKSDGTVLDKDIVYSSTALGGCYKTNGHTHNKTGTCGTTMTPNTYHVHANNATVSVVYSAINPGGCYVGSGHTHNVTGACSTGYTAHMHSSTCYVKKWHSGYTILSRVDHGNMYGGDELWYTYEINCPDCRGIIHHTGTNAAHNSEVLVCGDSPLNAGLDYTCGSSINTWVLGCNNLPLNAGSTRVYTCGSPVNTYVPKCGRRVNEIESASVVFAPSGS